jgi:hypothetical protein
MIWIMLLFSCSITFAQFDTYDLIVEYEQECYNDSSQDLRHVTTGSFGCFGTLHGIEGEEWKCENPSHYDELNWVHKEPRWDGFREFVKKKYQKLFEAKK